MNIKIAIESVRLNAKPSIKSPKNAVLAAQEFGVNLKNHMPKSIDRNLFEGSAVIMAMKTWYFKALKKQYPRHQDKIFLLPLFEKNKNKRTRKFYRYNIEEHLWERSG